MKNIIIIAFILWFISDIVKDKRIEYHHKKIKRNMCYDSMARAGIAVFGMCSGAMSDQYREENCCDCPYFRKTKE